MSTHGFGTPLGSGIVEYVALHPGFNKPLPPGIFFSTGLVASDSSMMQLLQDSENVLAPELLVAQYRGGGLYEASVSSGPRSGTRLNGGNPIDLEGLAEYARALGVTWIVPTVTATNEVEVALFADEMGIPWAAPPAVATFANKERNYRLRGEFRGNESLATPEWHLATSESQALEALEAIGLESVMKHPNGWGSLTVGVVDPSRGITRQVRVDVSRHFEELRQAARSNNIKTIVMRAVKGFELGAGGLLEDGEDIFFTTTRKRMTSGRRRKELGHDFDPADAQRLDLQPKIRQDLMQMFRRVHERHGPRGIRRVAFNADIIVAEGDPVFDDGTVVPVDVSLGRNGGSGMAMLACAELGVPAYSHLYEQLHVLWAAGRINGPEEFRPRHSQRAALTRVAFPRGGVSIRPTKGIRHVAHDVFAIQESDPKRPKPEMATVLSDNHPVVGTDGETFSAAQHQWYAHMADTNEAVLDADGNVTYYTETGEVTVPLEEWLHTRSGAAEPALAEASLSTSESSEGLQL